MSIAVCLLVYGLAVVALAPGPLLRLTASGVTPRLGVLAWLATIGTVVASGVVAAAFLAAAIIRD